MLRRLAPPFFVGSALGALVLLLVDRSMYPGKVRALLAPEGPAVGAVGALGAQLIVWVVARSA